MTNAPEELRETVRARYAAAATTSCCGAAPTDLENDAAGIAVFGASLSGEDATEVAGSLGCGVPTAVADLPPGETVLDLGSGAGGDVLIFARRVGPTGRAIGLDMTAEMLELARANATKAGLTDVEFLHGYLEEVPLPDDTVDVVISNCVLNLAADKTVVLREAARGDPIPALDVGTQGGEVTTTAFDDLVDTLAAPGTGLIMTMGKGGVGKTTVAAAVAVALAERGHRVHLTTTDPAAHVSATVGKGVDGLVVSRIDPVAETAGYTAEVMVTAGADLDDGARAVLAEDLASPARRRSPSSTPSPAPSPKPRTPSWSSTPPPPDTPCCSSTPPAPTTASSPGTPATCPTTSCSCSTGSGTPNAPTSSWWRCPRPPRCTRLPTCRPTSPAAASPPPPGC